MSMQQFVDSVRKTATAAGGSIFPYSQCLEPTNTLIKTMNATRNGVCLALSAKWMAEHAKGGSIWNWLCTPGTTNVRQSNIANLMINFHDSVERTGPLANASLSDVSHKQGFQHQDVFLDRYLGLNGMIRRKIVQNLIVGKQAFKSGSVAVAQQLARRLTPKWMNTMSGSYVHIAIFGNGGHSMCAFVGTPDVAFFDPNFGEFYFSSNDAFQKFFPEFWKKSGYIQQFTTFKLDAFANRL